MRTFAAIFAVFLVQCIHLYSHAQARAEPEAEPFDFFGVKSCVIGESDVINVYLYNSQFPEGKNLGNEQGCQYIDSSLPAVFITHGFTSSANDTAFQNLAKAFVQKGHTAFIVDWAEAACTYGWSGVKYAQYCFAAGNTRMIGELMAKYTIDLNNKCKIPLKNIMYAGHSLGSHVCGFAAKSVKAAKKESIPLIWAFDPAFPGFIGDKNCEERVCMTDTERLVVFKTSVLGIWDPIGHCNLQFGDGFSQPACANKGMKDQVECSHSESIVYATNIVKGSCQYRAVGTTWLNNDFSKGGSDKNFGEKVVDFLGSMFVPTLPGLECLSDGLKDKLLEAIKKTTTSPDATSKDCIALNIDTLKNDNTKGQYYVYTDCVKGTDINCEQK